MSKEDDAQRKRWVEDLSRNRFFRDWIGELDPQTLEFKRSVFLENLKENAAFGNDQEAIVARQMIKVHNSYMGLLRQYLQDGVVAEHEIAAEIAQIARERAA